jgi:endonuclease/exonuclease/phosphatase family metal-dependent hydrolase
MRLLTWNIHGCVGVDRRYSPERIAAVIRALSPDIVGLQEVDGRRPQHRGMSQIDYLLHETGLEGIVSPTLRHRGGGEYGNAVLSRWPIRDVRRHDLSIRRREPRGALDVDIDAPCGPIRVVSLHLGLGRYERAQQCEGLCAALGEVGSERMRLVVMGDFNEWTLTGGGRLSRLGERLATVISPRSFPAPAPVARLDRIYLDPPPESYELVPLPDPAARFVSDHRPVAADIRWPVHGKTG